MESVFVSLCSFFVENKEAIVSSLIANASFDALKNLLNFANLKQRIGKFFKDDSEAESFIENICETKVKNATQPEIDVKKIYEDIAHKNYDVDLFKEITQWIKENKNRIIEVSNMEFTNKSGFNIGVQNAGKNIYNINGDYKSNKKE